MTFLAANFLIAFIAALLLTPLATQLALRVGLCDKPSKMKRHRQPTALLGGLAVVSAMFLGMWLAAPEFPLLAAVTASMTLAALVGLVDDARSVAPKWKLLGLLPAPIVAILLWPEPILTPLVSIPVFVLGFLFVSNAVNLLDTVDGLTGLMTAVSAAALGIMALHTGLSGLAAVAFAMSGACMAFLFFNWRPLHSAAIFLGDMGTLAVGAGLFVITTYLVAHAETPLDAVAALLPIGLVTGNVFHTFYARWRIGERLLSRAHEHTSERLHRSGMPRVEVTLWLGTVTLLSSAAGVIAWISTSLAVVIISLSIGVAAILYLFYYSLRLKLPEDGAPWHREKTICRIITRLDVGGPSQHCVHLCEELKHTGWRSYLLHGNIDPRQETSMEYLLEGKSFESYRIPTMQREVRPLADLRAFIQIYRFIRRLRPQIVHTHHAKAGTMGRIAAALCQVPIVIHTYHGISLRDYFGPLKNSLFLAIEKICGSVSTALISTGPNDCEELIQMGVAPREKFVLLPLGLPFQHFADAVEHKRGQMRRELGMADRDLLVIYAGRLVPIKRPSEFVAMAAAVLQQRDDIRFVLLGEGPLRPELEQQIADLQVGDRVILYGVTDDMERVYADSDLFVLCSQREGMALVVMEALAAGVPVVATNVGDVASSVIHDVTGRLVAPGDTEALVAAVMTALDDREGSLRMAQVGQHHVLHSFSLEALVARIGALYTTLLTDSEYRDPRPLADCAAERSPLHPKPEQQTADSQVGPDGEAQMAIPVACTPRQSRLQHTGERDSYEPKQRAS